MRIDSLEYQEKLRGEYPSYTKGIYNLSSMYIKDGMLLKNRYGSLLLDPTVALLDNIKNNIEFDDLVIERDEKIIIYTSQSKQYKDLLEKEIWLKNISINVLNNISYADLDNLKF